VLEVSCSFLDLAQPGYDSRKLSRRARISEKLSFAWDTLLIYFQPQALSREYAPNAISLDLGVAAEVALGIATNRLKHARKGGIDLRGVANRNVSRNPANQSDIESRCRYDLDVRLRSKLN
jgi:hypothetical protein